MIDLSKYHLEKYNVPTPRYTSYPPANYFRDDITSEQAEQIIFQSNSEKPENLSFYLHIPFCSRNCLYCGCNTIITRDKNRIDQYVNSLKNELSIVANLIDGGRKISQIHWGGGTPNFLPVEYVEEIMSLFKQRFDFIEQPEIAMECHPGHLTYSYLDRLIEAGFNRFSLGIQDFNSRVLETVHRDDTAIPVEDLVFYLQQQKKLSVNLDFIYGLPFQDVASFKNTIQKAIKINPARLAVFSYAHVPWIKKAQKKLEQFGLPDSHEKITMFLTAHDLLTDAGYRDIGLDHFAKPNDELTKALDSKALHRNFQGYSTRVTTGQVYALGTSGISQLSNAYLQNTKDLKKYHAMIEQGHLPVVRGYVLNKNEKIIRYVIDELMCNLHLSWDKTAAYFDTTPKAIKEITRNSDEQLSEFQNEGLIAFNNHEVEITQTGKFFIRNIAATFDPLMKTSDKKFSKAL